MRRRNQPAQAPRKVTTTVRPRERSEFRLLNDELQKQYMRIKKISEDGNCLFRALADQLTGDLRHHRELRSQVLDHIESKEYHYAPYLLDQSFYRYCQTLRKDEQRGGQLELFAVSELFGVHICIHHVDDRGGHQAVKIENKTESVDMYLDEDSLPKSAAQPSSSSGATDSKRGSRHDAKTDGAADGASGSGDADAGSSGGADAEEEPMSALGALTDARWTMRGRVLHLSYQTGTHYNSVRALTDGDEGPVTRMNWTGPLRFQKPVCRLLKSPSNWRVMLQVWFRRNQDALQTWLVLVALFFIAAGVAVAFFQ